MLTSSCKLQVLTRGEFVGRCRVNGSTMLSSAVPRVLLVPLLMLVTTVDAGCQFPADLQTNRSTGGDVGGRDWVGRVRQQFTDVGAHVVVSGNIIRVSSTSEPPSYTLVCLQIVMSDRYLVAYEQTGQRTARYTCLQFLRRSPDVLQVTHCCC